MPPRIEKNKIVRRVCMIQKAAYIDMVMAGANVAKMMRNLKDLQKMFTENVQEAENVLTNLFRGEEFSDFYNTVGALSESYEMEEAIDALCSAVDNLSKDYYNPAVLRMAFVDSVSAVAFDEDNGEESTEQVEE